MDQTIVSTNYGQVEGAKEGNVFVWKGIPYAKPPIGSLRFEAPIAPERWDGIRNAHQFGPVAPQPTSEVMEFLGNEMESMSEDCLYLNIWSPRADDQKRPVMVWIHGGAFISGSGSSRSYDGSSFAENGDVVIVTINYRLGILGFLHLGEYSDHEYSHSANCGILDQIAALKWVQENIAAFGGDPDRVTIFGESAGAMSVGTLLTLPQAKGLFQQAILQSGAAANVISSEKATRVTGKLLSALGLEGDELARLKDIPVDQLIEASSQIPAMSLGPVLDGVTITKHPEKAITEGFAKDIPIIIGTNKDEFRLFTAFEPMWKNPDPAVVTSIFERTFSSFWPRLSEEFIGDRELNQTLYDEIMTRYVFTNPALKLAESQLENGAQVWMYRFDWESLVLGGLLKACHALEIPFVWNSFSKSNATKLTGDSPDLSKIAEQMHQAWIAFAHNGNPNTKAIPHWPNYELRNRPTLLLNTESYVENDPDRLGRLRWETMFKSR